MGRGLCANILSAKWHLLFYRTPGHICTPMSHPHTPGRPSTYYERSPCYSLNDAKARFVLAFFHTYVRYVYMYTKEPERVEEENPFIKANSASVLRHSHGTRTHARPVYPRRRCCLSQPDDACLRRQSDQPDSCVRIQPFSSKSIFTLYPTYGTSCTKQSRRRLV